MTDPRLDALLRDLPPPPVPAGLAARVLEAAAATPQGQSPPRTGRAAVRRDRRGRWLRRPILAGAVGLGLVVTSAVAATLAGVPIPQKIAAVFSSAEKAPEPKQAEAPRHVPRPAQAAPARTAQASAEPEGTRVLQPGPWRRLLMVQRIVVARRAMGLPTPGADRLERRLRRRAALWDAATPEQRAEWLERQQARRDARRAALATPEGRQTLVRPEQIRRWRAQRQAGIPLTPEQRAALREWRERRLAGIPPTPDERAARRAQLQAWRAQRQAGMPALTRDERLARQERFRRWREARQARWRAGQAQADEAPTPRAETTGVPPREGNGLPVD